MSNKNLDNRNRWRNKTVSFRMSPGEAATLDNFVKISGLSKQDYLCSRALQRQITVMGNPRVYKALRDSLSDVLDELKRISSGGEVPDELIDLIVQINRTLYGLKRGE
ncbi:MAG: hypothetical protein E7229_07115 [Clostridiales bacterium]|nr:hypothetical protein [Clostridiales bacterium]